MAEGLNSKLYNYFLGVLWGNSDSAYLTKSDMISDPEWQSFRDVILTLCKKSNSSSERHSSSDSHSAWEFLLKSRYHKHYYKNYTFARISPASSLETHGTDSLVSCSDITENRGNSFYLDMLKDILDSLHSVFENLKLDVLRRR